MSQFARSLGFLNLIGTFVVPPEVCVLLTNTNAHVSWLVGFATVTGGNSNQDLIWCVNMGEYMVFGSIAGSDYYGMAFGQIRLIMI